MIYHITSWMHSFRIFGQGIYEYEPQIIVNQHHTFQLISSSKHCFLAREREKNHRRNSFVLFCFVLLLIILFFIMKVKHMCKEFGFVFGLAHCEIQSLAIRVGCPAACRLEIFTHKLLSPFLIATSFAPSLC